MNYHIVTASSINFLKQASTATQANLYFKMRIKYRRTCQNLWFNKQCLRQKIIPKYINVQTKTTSNSAKIAVKKAQETWLKQECKHLYSKRFILQNYIKVLHSELTYKLHPIEFDILDDRIRSKVSEIIYKKYLIQFKKLENLKRQKSSIQINVDDQIQNFSERLINISDTVFNEQEINLLSKGPKYSPHINSKDIIDTLIVETEIALKNVENKDMSVAKIKKLLKTTSTKRNNQTDKITINSITNKIKENDLVVTKADKSNATVILNRTDYINRVKNFIESEDITQINRDPTKKYQSNLKQSLTNIQIIFSDFDKRKMINMNPSSPKLYGLIKTHKPDNPIRPVVSYINSPTRNLAVKLNTAFKEYTGFTPKHGVKNSLELVQNLKDSYSPHNSFLVSFDVKNMFSNIPTDECFKLIQNLLDRSKINTIIAAEFLTAFDTCLTQNYFQFQNQFFTQNSGLPMGSPLSPLLADIFMSNLEEQILKSHHGQNYIQFWYRYVDDVLACFKGTTRQLHIFLDFINNLHPNIKFTLEKETDNKINFLDLTITHENNQFKFDIFRKPTFTDITIPYDSCHPYTHKLAAYNSMLHRAFSLPLSEIELKRELNTIQDIARNNGFPKELIRKLINKKQNQFTFKLIYPTNKNEKQNYYATITYHDTLSIKIANILSKHDINIAFKPQYKSSGLIYNAKDKINKYDKSGVYKLSCSDCNSVYIGQSGRNFKTRYIEHNRSFRLQKTDSTFANHLLDCGHQFPDINSMKVLHCADKGIKLNLLEAIEIYKHNQDNNINILNDQLDIMYSPLFTATKRKDSDSHRNGP